MSEPMTTMRANQLANDLRPFAWSDERVPVPNTSGVVPKDTHCLVLPDPPETKKGSIILSDDTIEKEAWKRQKCTLIACGAMAFHDWGEDKPISGERVFVAQYAGSKIEADDGLTYWIIKDDDVIGGLT